MSFIDLCYSPKKEDHSHYFMTKVVNINHSYVVALFALKNLVSYKYFNAEKNDQKFGSKVH